MGNPPAHRRLVPRVPKKEAKQALEDLEVTSQQVIEMEMESDVDLPRNMPAGSVDLADESLEMTAVRANFLPPPDADDFDEMTAKHVVDSRIDDFDGDFVDDAGETVARIPQQPPEQPRRETLAHMLAESAIPNFDDVENKLADNGPDSNPFSDSEPTTLKAPTSPDAEDRPMSHVSPAERGLLAAMSEGHEASRMVYMKWLEKRGEVVRGEFLRVDAALAQMSPDDPRYAHKRQRLLELSPRISVDWRSRVSRALIEGCTTTTGRCPAYWRALPNDTDDARNCNVCGDDVFYCVTIDLARSRVVAQQRVAVDMTVDRYHGDLDAPAQCASCRSQVPRNTRFCPHCGRSQV